MLETACDAQRATRSFDRGCGAKVMADGRRRAEACGKAAGVSGKGHVRVVWAPDGSVERVVLDENPFQNPDVERCIVASFEKERMPPVTQEKPISIGIDVTLE